MIKSEIITRLTQLRRQIQRETDGLTEDQACLLSDVCRSLDLSDQDTAQVVGPATTALIASPVRIEITTDGLAALNGRLVTPIGPWIELRLDTAGTP